MTCARQSAGVFGELTPSQVPFNGIVYCVKETTEPFDRFFPLVNQDKENCMCSGNKTLQLVYESHGASEQGPSLD